MKRRILEWVCSEYEQRPGDPFFTLELASAKFGLGGARQFPGCKIMFIQPKDPLSDDTIMYSPHFDKFWIGVPAHYIT